MRYGKANKGRGTTPALSFLNPDSHRSHHLGRGGGWLLRLGRIRFANLFGSGIAAAGQGGQNKDSDGDNKEAESVKHNHFLSVIKFWVHSTTEKKI